MAVSKALRQLFFIDRSLQLGIWNEQNQQDWLHDVQLMYQYKDLRRLTLEVLGADNTVVLEYGVDFDVQALTPQRLTDSGQGIELPLIDRRLLAGHRVLVYRHGREDQYRHLLTLAWSNAATLTKRAGVSYESEHAKKITGGRQSGSFHVGAEARQRLIVSQAGNRGYAFASAPALGNAPVFLHQKFAPPTLQFVVGQSLSAIICQTPRGLQARSILPA